MAPHLPWHARRTCSEHPDQCRSIRPAQATPQREQTMNPAAASTVPRRPLNRSRPIPLGSSDHCVCPATADTRAAAIPGHRCQEPPCASARAAGIRRRRRYPACASGSRARQCQPTVRDPQVEQASRALPPEANGEITPCGTCGDASTSTTSSPRIRLAAPTDSPPQTEGRPAQRCRHAASTVRLDHPPVASPSGLTVAVKTPDLMPGLPRAAARGRAPADLMCCRDRGG